VWHTTHATKLSSEDIYHNAGLWGSMLHVSTFATTRVALPTRGRTRVERLEDSHTRGDNP
jgi:hypothetical protein